MTEPARDPGLEEPPLPLNRASALRLRAKRESGAAETPRPPAFDGRGKRDYKVRRLLAATDVIALALSLALALALSQPAGTSRQLLWGLVALPAWVVVFKLYGLYDRDVKRISHTTVDDLPWIFHALLLGGLLLWLFYRAVPAGNVEALPILGFGMIALLTVPVGRAIIRRAIRRMLGPERVLLIGDGEVVPALIRKMRMHPEYGLEPVSVISVSAQREANGSRPTYGDLEDRELVHEIEAGGVDRVVVSHQSLDEPTLLALMHRCRALSLKMSVLPQLFDALGSSVEVDDVEGITVLGINPPVLSRSSRLLKRGVDLLGAGVLLVIAAPLVATIAVAIKLDSPGPIFFTQQRIGKLGAHFRLVKFRTMVADAERRREDLLARSADPDWLLLEHDPRVTRVGRLLRLTSLDELPQLWNVLKGEMSLVGPRPLIDDEDSKLIGWTRTRSELTPGLTGLWQVLGRTNISFEEMVKLDYLYVTNWSLWTDIRLMIRTLPAVVTRRGAN